MTAKRLPGPTSARQVEANRRNAGRSTGPRTEAGKAASAQNATRHGMYGLSGEPIARGPFAEDRDEVATWFADVVGALAPRDGLERAVAAGIARTMLRGRRIDRFEAEVFHQASRWTRRQGLREVDVVAESQRDFECAQAFCDFVEAGEVPSADVDGSQIASWVWKALDSEVDPLAPESWNDGELPVTPEEWWGTLAGLVEQEWSDRGAALRWAEQQVAVARDTARGDRERAAEGAAASLLEKLPKVAGLHTQVQRDLKRQLDLYVGLQQRALPDHDPDREEDDTDGEETVTVLDDEAGT